MGVAVNAGLMSSVQQEWPEEIQENWKAKLEGIREWCWREVNEIQAFAEAFDE